MNFLIKKQKKIGKVGIINLLVKCHVRLSSTNTDDGVFAECLLRVTRQKGYRSAGVITRDTCPPCYRVSDLLHSLCAWVFLPTQGSSALQNTLSKLTGDAGSGGGRPRPWRFQKIHCCMIWMAIISGILFLSSEENKERRSIDDGSDWFRSSLSTV